MYTSKRVALAALTWSLASPLAACSSNVDLGANRAHPDGGATGGDGGAGPGADGSGPGTDGGGSTADGSAAACTLPFAKAPDVMVGTATATTAAPALVWNGVGYGVLWSAGAVSLASTDAHGNPSAGAANLGSYEGATSLAWNGSGYGAFFNDGDDVNLYAQITSATGVSMGPVQLLASDPTSDVTLAAAPWSGSQYLVFFQHYTLLNRMVVTAAGEASGSAVDLGDCLGGGLPAGIVTQAIWAGDRFAAILSEFGNMTLGRTAAGVYLAEFDGNGIAMGQATLLASLPAQTTAPASVTWTGSDYRIAWMTAGQLSTTRMSRGGAPDPVTTTPLAANAMGLSSTWDGTSFGVLATSGSGFAFARYTPAGAAVDAPIVLSNTSTYAQLLWTGREYAVGWSDGQSVWLTRIGSCP